ncbi:DUF2933 domain-containing protein [Sphaerimonospora sp. CA-214678]|uniref:DUF2933 domain-containing protein n=1 Tax=Sphaerimonospora sp. CA-214678 TaxID=3240029 RepID=UPI003D8B0939
MKRSHLPLYAIALAILIVGLVATGVPISTILLALLVLACPLMMLFMHGSHGDHDTHGGHADREDASQGRDTAHRH